MKQIYRIADRIIIAIICQTVAGDTKYHIRPVGITGRIKNKISTPIIRPLCVLLIVSPFLIYLVIVAPHSGHFLLKQGTPRLWVVVYPQFGHTQLPIGPACAFPPMRPTLFIFFPPFFQLIHC